MSREAHERFCESVAVRSRRAIRPVVESFFSSLKNELTHDRSFQDRTEARHAIFEYIEGFYNRTRLHQTLGSRSPEGFEQQGGDS